MAPFFQCSGVWLGGVDSPLEGEVKNQRNGWIGGFGFLGVPPLKKTNPFHKEIPYESKPPIPKPQFTHFSSQTKVFLDTQSGWKSWQEMIETT